jgi:hypothetical protein
VRVAGPKNRDGTDRAAGSRLMPYDWFSRFAWRFCPGGTTYSTTLTKINAYFSSI